MSVRIVTGVLQRFPRALEKMTLLRIENFRFARRVPKEVRIEEFDTFHHAACFDEIRVLQQLCVDAVSEQLFIAEETDQLGTGAQLLPKLVEVLRLRKATRHADDRELSGKIRCVDFTHCQFQKLISPLPGLTLSYFATSRALLLLRGFAPSRAVGPGCVRDGFDEPTPAGWFAFEWRACVRPRERVEQSSVTRTSRVREVQFRTVAARARLLASLTANGRRLRRSCLRR